MGLEFLRQHGAHRLRVDPIRPVLLSSDALVTPDEKQNLAYERSLDRWAPIAVLEAAIPADWPWCPIQFIDGKDSGRTVAWLATDQGYPIPIMLAEIGAMSIRLVDRRFIREWSTVERVVCMIADPFPWDEIESFGGALQQEGFRFLPCLEPRGRLTFDYQELRRATHNRTLDETARLEKQAMVQAQNCPTVLDGRLASRSGGFDEARCPVVGVIKEHYQNYLHHPQAGPVLLSLSYGQRTPAFRLVTHNLVVVSWYVRVDQINDQAPDHGIVRLEIPDVFFCEVMQQDWTYLDQLSRFVCEYRSRDSGYARAAVSLYPIQRAEELLGALFVGAETLAQWFYYLVHL